MQRLIENGEQENVEFKGDRRQPLNDDAIVDAVVCLANRRGTDPAWLLIGVEDDGTVTGARPRHGTATDPARLAALIAGRTRPAVPVDVTVADIDGMPVIVIVVPPQRVPIGLSKGVFVRRALDSDGRPVCLPMDGAAIQSLQASRGEHDPSEQIVSGATWDDLEPLEFARFRRSIEERIGSDRALLALSDLDLAKALGVVDANGTVRSIRLGGLLLFGREASLRRLVPTHEVAFQMLRGLKVTANDFFRWPLIRMIEEIETQFRVRNEEAELMVGFLRVGIPNFPATAIREAVANALVHRDYLRLGTVHVQLTDDTIEVSSPGGFPNGVRLDNLLVTAPHPRNKLLADAFKRAGIVDRTARGIDTMFFEQLRNGRRAPSFAYSTPTTVSVVFPIGPANLGLVRLLVMAEREGRDFGLDELLILDGLMPENSLDLAAAMRLTQKPAEMTQLVLDTLTEYGFVERHNAAWTLSRLVRDAIKRPPIAGWPTAVEFSAEEAILGFIDAQGRITRRDAASVLGMSPQQANRLLARMLETGQLVRHGASRGVWYERKRSADKR